MAVLRAMVTLPKDSGVPEDAVTNVFYFDGDATTGTATAITTALSSFYTAVMPQLSSTLNPTTARVRFYDMGDSKPRAPFHDVFLTIGATTGPQTAAPELAICLSFQGARTSGVPQARRRGRIYLGPLGYTGIGAAETVNVTAVDAIAAAGGALMDASDAASNWSWVVYSQVEGANAWAVVNNGWCDNAFDVQRRRGIASTYRKTFT